MGEIRLSDAEKCFIIHGINDDFRIDGRRCFDRRSFEISTDLIPSCAGSAQVRIGNCQVLVGVKMNLIKPDINEPKRGKVEFFLDISANASPFFEGKGGQDIADEITSLLDNSYQHCSFLNDLCVIPGQNVWCIFVDALVLETGSKPSLCDAVSVAIKAALFDTKIPKVFVNEIDEIQISDNPFDIVKLNLDDVPIFTCLTRISNRYILDSTQEEEASAISSILFAVTPQGDIVHIKKLGYGSLHCEPIPDIIRKVSELTKELHISLQQLEKMPSKAHIEI